MEIVYHKEKQDTLLQIKLYPSNKPKKQQQQQQQKTAKKFNLLLGRCCQPQFEATFLNTTPQAQLHQ